METIDEKEGIPAFIHLAPAEDLPAWKKQQGYSGLQRLRNIVLAFGASSRLGISGEISGGVYGGAMNNFH